MDQLFGCSSAGGGLKYTIVGDCPLENIEHEIEGVYIPSPFDVDNDNGPPSNYHDDMDEASDLNNCHVRSAWEEMWTESIPTPTPRATQNERDETRRGKRVLESDGPESNKSARTDSFKRGGATAMVCEKLDGIMQTITERNTTMMNLFKIVDSSKYSVADALAKICALPNLEPGTPEFSFACMLIEDPQKRTILFGLPSDKAIVEWIKFMYNERNK